jgi:predicted kinase
MKTEKPILFIFSGLPGTGKSTIAKHLSSIFKAAYFRIDTIEQGIRDLFSVNITDEGYKFTHLLCKDNLLLNNNVVADSCNPFELTRREWENVAKTCNSHYINIEMVCKNTEVHKSRIENRKNEVVTLELPTWNDVLHREYHPWTQEHLVIDTSENDIKECILRIQKNIDKFIK